MVKEEKGGKRGKIENEEDEEEEEIKKEVRPKNQNNWRGWDIEILPTRIYFIRECHTWVYMRI